MYSGKPSSTSIFFSFENPVKLYILVATIFLNSFVKRVSKLNKRKALVLFKIQNFSFRIKSSIMSKNLSELSGRKGLDDNLFNRIGELAKPDGTPSIEELDKLAKEFLIGSANTYGTATFYDF